MKRSMSLITLTALVAAWALVGCNENKAAQTSAAGDGGDVRVHTFKGVATVMRDGEVAPLTVTAKMLLRSSDVIRTSVGAQVVVKLGEDRGMFTIGEKTNISLANLAAGDTNLDIQDGKVKLALTKITGERKFNLNTPTAVAGVRGTTFMLDIKSTKKHAFPYAVQLEDGSATSTKLAVLTGAVAVLDPEAKAPEKLVDSLKMTTIAEGVKFEDIKIEKIDLRDISEFREISEIEELKKMKMEDELKLIKRAEAGELDAIITETANVPKLQSKTLAADEAKIEAERLKDTGSKEAIRAKGKAKLDSKQLKVDPAEINF